MGLCSTPCVDSGLIYYVTPGCVLICSDLSGKIAWKVDMMKDLGVTPFHLGNCSPLVHRAISSSSSPATASTTNRAR